MAEDGWVLSIDFGTTYSLAAWWREGRSVEVLDVSGDRRVPSVVHVDGERIVVGRVAEDLASSDPARALRTPKRRLGDPAPAVLGGQAHDVSDLVAALLGHVAGEAFRHHGTAPDVVRLTHPAAWGGARRQALVDAAGRAGLGEVDLVAEPVAAAISYAAESGLGAGGRVLVYDLGGGTFDTAALESTAEGFVVIGRPGGDQTVGGELFDELVVNEIGERLDPGAWNELQVSDDPMWRQAAARLRVEARRAKEALSSYPWVDVLVPLPWGMVQHRLTQAELRAIIEPHIADTVEILAETAEMAGLSGADIDAIHLVGGASRTPLVPELVSAAFPGTTVSQRGDPKAAVAMGAAHPMAAQGRIGRRRSADGDARGPGAGPVPTGPPPPRPPTADAPPPPTPAHATTSPGDAAPPAPPAASGAATNGTNRVLLVVALVAVVAVVGLGAMLAGLMIGGGGDGDGDDLVASDDTSPADDTDDADADASDSAAATTTAPAGDTLSADDLPLDDLLGGLGDASSRTEREPAGPGDEALAAALLRADDLPGDGWREEAPAPIDGLCGHTPAEQPDAAEEIAFGAGAAFELRGVYSGIARYGDAAAARAAFDDEAANAAGCGSSQLDPVGLGVPFDAETSVLDTADVGVTLPDGCDDVAAWVVEIGDELLGLSLAAVHVSGLCGDVVTTVQVHVNERADALTPEWAAALDLALADAAAVAG
ncbi:MAG: Hsp70 family protein [Actinomycetota bacterium]|nr:Hsp70 family protein [Actinomycetota bacterium]